jgi:hypothetical protein
MSGRWRLYLLADQIIVREGGPSSNRGLTLFAGFTYANPSTAIIQYFWEAGLVKQGTFPGRDNDSIAFAVSQSLVSNRDSPAGSRSARRRRPAGPSPPGSATGRIRACSGSPGPMEKQTGRGAPWTSPTSRRSSHSGVRTDRPMLMSMMTQFRLERADDLDRTGENRPALSHNLTRLSASSRSLSHV